MTEPDPAKSDPLQEANDKIRGAAKWLIASSAAVGAALLAGSQLSNIGKLEGGTRLWVAVGGAATGLTAVVVVIWLAVQLLVPVTVTIEELSTWWRNPDAGKKRPGRRLHDRGMREASSFFEEHPKYLQGFASPEELIEARSEAVSRTAVPDWYVDRPDDNDEKRAADLDDRISAVERIAQNRALEGRFKATLRFLVAATAAAAAGIVLFAWASNPPPARPPAADMTSANLSNANLRDADLRNAVLDHVNLTGADLTGADLRGASTVGVVWAGTTCPDGTNSDAVGGTCAGHLSGPR
ncbi:pentapeptide repeat-containing protein [Kitasatospora cineracea]|uniref:pentapeptide repeat-containing protein n=1 Tax=Kitasatospora cineracea TaxID=88074 RepID=UPI0037B2F9D1